MPAPVGPSPPPQSNNLTMPLGRIRLMPTGAQEQLTGGRPDVAARRPRLDVGLRIGARCLFQHL
jgi:hypothetical protein